MKISYAPRQAQNPKLFNTTQAPPLRHVTPIHVEPRVVVAGVAGCRLTKHVGPPQPVVQAQ